MRVEMQVFEANVAEFVARAAEGEEIVVIDGGRPVVRLVAWSKPADVRRSRSQLSTLEALNDDRG